MDGAQGGVTIADRIGKNADGEQVIDLTERAALALRFEVNRIEALDAAFHFGGQAIFGQIFAKGLLHLGQGRIQIPCCDRQLSA